MNEQMLESRRAECMARERLIGAAQALCGVQEDGGENRGAMVELFLSEVHLQPGDPWCAAFVAHLGFWSQYDAEKQRSLWPLPMTGGCAYLGAFAQRHGLLRETPRRGDVFLLYSGTLRRFAHTGIVVEAAQTTSGYTCVTVEGNTNDDGSREGTKSCVKIRTFPSGGLHRFIRWTETMPDEARKAA